MLPPGADEIAPRVDPLSCEGCAVCRQVCPTGAVEMTGDANGEWYLSRTRFGPLVHARLGPGGDNSGALVEQVRRVAARAAEEQQRGIVLVDAPPGTGCPVISSLTGADLALAVTEPTPSGESDLLRVLDLARHFGIPTAVVVNKADLDPGRTSELTVRVEAAGSRVIARLPYDETVSRAVCEGRILSEYSAGWRDRLELIWTRLSEMLEMGATAALPGDVADDKLRVAAQGEEP
jgi:MinD superfamily P-loop ATPase